MKYLLIAIVILTFSILVCGIFVLLKRTNLFIKILMGILCVVLVILIPFLINESYKVGTGYITEWGANDVLSFYGSILSFLGTVFLGGLALYQNHKFEKNGKEQRRLAVRPYLFTRIDDENVSILAKQQVEYIDINIANQDSFEISTKRNPPIQLDKYLELVDKLEKNPNMDTPEKIKTVEEQTNILKEMNKRYELISYEVENYGNAAAVKIDVLLNGKRFYPTFAIHNEVSHRLLFLCDFQEIEINQQIRFDLEFSYYDIEGYGPYIQKETFFVDKLKNEFLQLHYLDQISSPKSDRNE